MALIHQNYYRSKMKYDECVSYWKNLFCKNVLKQTNPTSWEQFMSGIILTGSGSYIHPVDEFYKGVRGISPIFSQKNRSLNRGFYIMQIALWDSVAGTTIAPWIECKIERDSLYQFDDNQLGIDILEIRTLPATNTENLMIGILNEWVDPNKNIDLICQQVEALARKGVPENFEPASVCPD